MDYHVPESWDMLPKTQVGSGSYAQTVSYGLYRDYEKAKTNYCRVLEIEPQHPQGLGFLGMVYHHLEDTDQAIIKYHEVRSSLRRREPSLTGIRL